MGSNIDSEANLRAAAARLRNIWPALCFSSVWKSRARDVENQPDFLNAVATFLTDESMNKIFDQLLSVEKELKKNVQFRFGPRTIDLDVLLVDSIILPSMAEWQKNSRLTAHGSRLFIPHPKLHERRFVLEPLIELVGGEFLHPVFHSPLKEFLQNVKEQECEKVRMKLL